MMANRKVKRRTNGPQSDRSRRFRVLGDENRLRLIEALFTGPANVTALAGLTAGAHVNLEDALRAGEPYGGHIVQGHVDGTGVVQGVADEGFARILRIGGPPELLRYVIEKGSVALDGVSLTVAEVGDDWLTVSLIPETQERTTLGSLAEGESVNIEVDMFAKYAERLAQK